MLLSFLLLGPPAAIYLSYLSGKAFYRRYSKPVVGSVTAWNIILALSLLPMLIVALIIMVCLWLGFSNVKLLLHWFYIDLLKLGIKGSLIPPSF